MLKSNESLGFLQIYKQHKYKMPNYDFLNIFLFLIAINQLIKSFFLL